MTHVHSNGIMMLLSTFVFVLNILIKIKRLYFVLSLLLSMGSNSWKQVQKPASMWKMLSSPLPETLSPKWTERL